MEHDAIVVDAPQPRLTKVIDHQLIMGCLHSPADLAQIHNRRLCADCLDPAEQGFSSINRMPKVRTRILVLLERDR